MNCIKCNCSVSDRMLHRTKPKGQSDAGWMCMPCIDKTEPELASNIRGDYSDVEKTLEKEFYKKTFL